MIGNIFRGFRLHKTLARRIRGAKIALLLMPGLVILVGPAMTAQVIADPQGPFCRRFGRATALTRFKP